ncbi:VOC family protein [Microbacterium sp. zg.Y1090]|uniref:VOC family protein n=1 Tax=Microbacterium TaxID=33882 RepID=UPI00214B8EE2|nr:MULTISPECIES: VOC family protein [unclassified Microbacterium]MCR2813325.1 VOC family protein [Microbacterium sp. zg.Y1084]MCR2819841.1 VOC family protein [Microbacterium sp. zg.Y1090]MDL5487952.1 VOC family protein [Microbacterium sp. zg-Y1211]WIM28602.1 VOC family protein [Microbacterium sp. zg-Y1090]
MTRLHHVGITVSDAGRAAAFYAAATEGTVIGPLVKSGPAVEAAVGHPGVEVVLTFVEGQDGVFIELAEYRHAPARAIDPDTAHVAAAHPAIVVDDLEAALARVAVLGYSPLSATMTATQGPMEGYRYVYVLGPDSVRVELLQEPH